MFKNSTKDNKFENFISYLKSSLCSKHKLPVAHICTDCKEIICFQCGIEHKSHTNSFISLDSDINFLKMNFMGLERKENHIIAE